MNLNNLYDLAEKEHIKIYDYYIENAYGTSATSIYERNDL